MLHLSLHTSFSSALVCTAFGVAAAALAACSGHTPPAVAPAERVAEPVDDVDDVDDVDAAAVPSETSEASEASEATDEAAAEAPPPPQEKLSSLCNKMCDAVAPKCTSLQLKGCKSTCDNYDSHPEACDAVVRNALECARVDKDFLFCANVVPDSCAKEFKAINTCKETGAPPADAVKQGMPSGWERFKANGFSVVVPKGMKASSEQGIKKWTVKGANGVSYEVALRPPPQAAKLNNRAFLRAGNEVFGKCAPKLKLHALVEKPGHTSIQFNTTCPDGSKQVGRMHVVGSQMYVLTAYLGADANAETDAFVYSFESK